MAVAVTVKDVGVTPTLKVCGVVEGCKVITGYGFTEASTAVREALVQPFIVDDT